MKHNILIQQKVAVDLNLGLDIVDLAVFAFVKDFMLSFKCERKEIDGKCYVWVNPQIAIDELPLVGITTTRGINMRLEKLINAGLLERYEGNKNLHKCYICPGAKFSLYDFSGNEIPEAPKPIEKKPVEKKPRNLAFPFDSEDFFYWWGELLKESKWKTKSDRALQMSLDRLKGFTEQEAISAIKRSIESGWQGIFPEKERERNMAQSRRAYSQVNIDEIMQ